METRFAAWSLGPEGRAVRWVGSEEAFAGQLGDPRGGLGRPRILKEVLWGRGYLRLYMPC